MAVAGDERVGKPDAAIELDAGICWGTGSGWDAYADILQFATGISRKNILSEQRIHARDVASLGLAALIAGKTVAPEAALPVYIRDNVAVKSTKSLRR